MHLHGAWADIKIPGNNLAAAALDQFVVNLCFSLGQISESLMKVTIETVLALCKGLVDAVQQLLLAVRLFYEIDGARLQCSYGHAYIAMPGDEDDRDIQATCAQSFLESEATHSCHSYIENQASRFPWRIGFHECLCRLVGFGIQPDGFHQLQYGVPHRLVVVDNVHGFLVDFIHAVMPKYEV